MIRYFCGLLAANERVVRSGRVWDVKFIQSLFGGKLNGRLVRLYAMVLVFWIFDHCW